MKAPRNSLVPQPCLVCGTMFKPQRTGMRFCSRKCSAQWKLANGLHPRRPKDPTKYGVLTCPVCGNDFTYLLTQPPRRCCSRHCASILRGREKRHPFQRPKNPANWVKAACPVCGKEFEYKRSWPRVFCSHECAGKARVSNIKHWAPTGYDATCEICGTVFRADTTRRGRFCSLKCFGKWQSVNIRGEAHPSWRGGKEPYYGPTWDAARKFVRERDQVCQGCGVAPEELGHSLDVHHLIPFRTFGRARHAEANDLANLVALCNTCHAAWEWAGRRGEPYPIIQRESA